MAKLTVPLAALWRALSSPAAAPTTHWVVAGIVSQRPLPLSVHSSSWVTVRVPLPASTVTLKVASSAPSAAVAALPFPTRSRSLPSKRNDNDGGGGVTRNAPGNVALSPGLFTVTSRGPSVASSAIRTVTANSVADTVLVCSTVTPAPKLALVPEPNSFP